MDLHKQSMKGVCLLVKHHLHKKFYDIKKLNEVTPKQIMEGLTDKEQLKRLIEALELTDLIKQLGLSNWDNVNESVIDVSFFKWNR